MVVGADSPYAIERFYVKHISENNLVSRVGFFTAQNKFLEYYKTSIWRKIWYRTGLSGILPAINKELLNTLSTEPWDAVFVFKGMEILPQTLAAIRKLSIKLINFNPDSPFIFSGKGSGNDNITDSIRLYDLYLSYDHSVVERLQKEYGIRSALLPFGFELEQETYNDCLAVEEIVGACFVGNPDRQRARFILQLAKEGIAMDVYGNEWDRFVSHRNVKVHSIVYHEEFWKILRCYRVQLNLMRPHNPHSHNMRTFEIPAVGGIQVAPNTRDHALFFESEKEIFLFNEVGDCVTQIGKLLKMSKTSASEIRMAARSRSIISDYSYRNRSKQVIDEIHSLLQ